MLKRTFFSFITAILINIVANAQLQVVKGVVIASEDVEGIHVLNKTSVKYTVTNTDGAFEILAKANDTLTISSLKYETKEVIITKASIAINNLTVFLIEKINQLDEVVVGKILTGNLGSDMANLNTKAPINFYDLGIPGYVGKPKTINERKLADADGGSWGAVSGGPFGGGVSLNVYKLLNRVSGRTKKLKDIVVLDAKEKCRKDLKADYSAIIFKNIEWTETVMADYFYFCMDDLQFLDICNRKDPTEILSFLNKKLEAYHQNLTYNKD